VLARRRRQVVAAGHRIRDGRIVGDEIAVAGGVERESGHAVAPERGLARIRRVRVRRAHDRHEGHVAAARLDARDEAHVDPGIRDAGGVDAGEVMRPDDARNADASIGIDRDVRGAVDPEHRVGAAERDGAREQEQAVAGGQRRRARTSGRGRDGPPRTHCRPR
jgi:hypothetical protein